MNDTESQPEVIPTPEQPSRSIFWKMANILASPSEAYDELVGRPAKAVNWLVPVICMCVMGLIYVTIVFSQPSVKQQMRELQTKALADIQRAYESIDQSLDIRQQARFRIFEQEIEQRKLQLLMRARQQNRANRPLANPR